jgi:hypothetical protein
MRSKSDKRKKQVGWGRDDREGRGGGGGATPPLLPIRYSRQPSTQLHMPFNPAAHAHANIKWHVQLGATAQSTPQKPKANYGISRMHMPMWLRFLVDASFT